VAGLARISETWKVFDDAGVAVNGIDTSIRFTFVDPNERAAQREPAKINCEIAEDWVRSQRKPGPRVYKPCWKPMMISALPTR